MPRIEIIPAGWEESEEKREGNGTPTIDVCDDCAVTINEGDPLDEIGDESLARQHPGATIGSTDVEHPEYDHDYKCELCGASLGDPPEEEDDDEDEPAGDDLCDICMTSGVNVDRTTPCGKTIGIECGCDKTHADGKCGREDCEECNQEEPVDAEG